MNTQRSSSARKFADRPGTLVGSLALVAVLALVVAQWPSPSRNVAGQQSVTSSVASGTNPSTMAELLIEPPTLEEIMTYGWVASTTVESIEPRKYLTLDGGPPPASAVGFNQSVVLVTLKVESWLRLGEGLPQVSYVLVADDNSPPLFTTHSLGRSGVAVFLPYSPDPDERLIALTESAAKSAALDSHGDVSSGGLLKAWLPDDGAGNLTYKYHPDTVSLGQVVEIIDSPNPPVSVLKVAPRTQVEDTTLADSSDIQTDVAAMARRALVVDEPATVTNNAESVARAPFFRPNLSRGPMSRETAIEESTKRFPPGEPPVVAFAYRMRFASALAALGEESNAGGEHPVWFVGLTRSGMSAKEHHAFFDVGIGPDRSLTSDAETAEASLKVLGEYYIWSAETSAIMQMGGLTEDTTYGSDLSGLLGLPEDAPDQ